jgi:uncharacterized protein YwgA
MITDRIIEMNMMLASEENKYTEMLYALKKFYSISGKEALQKIMYFASIKSNTYSFQWNKFGPYSEELKYTFDDAIMEGTIDYTPSDIPMRYGQQSNLKLTSQGEEVLGSFVLDNDTKESIEFAYQILKDKSLTQMQLLSSVHYILRHNDGKTDVLSVLNILKKLKPNTGFKQEDIIPVIEELKELKLLV